ncbi:lanosterol 14-alpha demethylase isoform X4 [Anser cygnoides]|uniref:lanosterol 14-alpha demethylase isoform X4 n=1 Tax=Anser cygnoides TaxID=8845 RepID=UPI0034D33A82
MSHEVPKADQESRKMTENESKSDIPGKKHEYESSAERNASTVPQGVPEAGVRKLTFASDTNDTGELNQELSEAVNADARPDTLSSAENPESAEKGSTFLMPEEKDENFTLRLNDKGLQDTPLLTFESQNLKRLFLHNNELKTLHLNVGNLTNLEILLLERNRLTCLPPEISFLHKLTVLNVSHNQLLYLPKEFSKLVNLKELFLNHNNMDEFPFALRSLETLELAGNKLKTLPDAMADMEKLKLTQIPEELSKLVCLRELDISHNALKEMPDSIGELEYLVHLIANNNDISQLPKSITSLRNLQHLDLSENRLKSLPAGLHHLHLLKDINFDGNFLFEPLKDLCRGKQLHPILCYLESANERDEKILRKMIEVIADNVASEDFEFFCQKLQLRQADIKSLENTRTLNLKEKIIKALDIWISENQDLTYAEMVDKLIRILVMTGMCDLTNKVKALKLYSQMVKF